MRQQWQVLVLAMTLAALAWLAAADTAGQATTKAGSLASASTTATSSSSRPATSASAPADYPAACAAFVASPSTQAYRDLTALLVKSPSYSPYSFELDAMEEAADDPEAVLRTYQASQLNLMSSPRAHRLAARAAYLLEQKDIAKSHVAMFDACIEGILSTGDGTRARPYLVMRVSDEYDLLQCLRKASIKQALHKVGGRSYDVLTCADKTELWFDVTAPFGALVRGLTPSSAPEE